MDQRKLGAQIRVENAIAIVPFDLPIRFYHSKPEKRAKKIAPLHVETGCLVMILRRDGVHAIVSTELFGRTHLGRVPSNVLSPLAPPRPGSLSSMGQYAEVRDEFVTQALKVFQESEARG